MKGRSSKEISPYQVRPLSTTLGGGQRCMLVASVPQARAQPKILPGPAHLTQVRGSLVRNTASASGREDGRGKRGLIGDQDTVYQGGAS
jgi:hypothetical protein